jgi:hypothetical protein
MLLLRQANHATGGLPESDPIYGGNIRPTAGLPMHELPSDHLLRMQQQNQPLRLREQCMGRHALCGKHTKRDIRSYHGLTNRFLIRLSYRCAQGIDDILFYSCFDQNIK